MCCVCIGCVCVFLVVCVVGDCCCVVECVDVVVGYDFVGWL